jgi:formylglycine-generating enzyme required for sulfatase activity
MLRAVIALLLLLVPSIAKAEARLALVISNAGYPAEIGRLENPHKDSAVIAAALEAVGFERRNITILKDADQPTMRMAVAEFIDRIDMAGPDAVAFLYYSGHGAADRTDRGENYLIPVGAKITLAKQLPILGVSLSEVTKALERVPAKARFVVVDACRNVAFTKGLKDAAKGFVPERKLDGMIVAFATRPGETAEDNNVYSAALASVLPTPGLRAEEVFKETQLKVADLTKGTQIPWTEDGLLTRFWFKVAAAQPNDAARADDEVRAKAEAERQRLAILEQLATEARNKKKQNDEARAKPEAERQRLAMLEQLAADAIRKQTVARDDATPGRVLRDCSECPEMVVVPAGSFMMGSNDGGIDEKPVHKVTFAKPFAVGKFEVTVGEYLACVAARACPPPEWNEPGSNYNVSTFGIDHYHKLGQALSHPQHPIVGVSWHNAKQYAAWLSEQTSKKPYRLLSEAEWEYAARAGSGTKYTWGDEIGRNRANCDGCGSQWDNKHTAPVGSFQANAFGLHDIHGNVWEWIADCHKDSYANAPSDGTATSDVAGCSRVMRGGSWVNNPKILRSANRGGNSPASRLNNLGFRVARTLNP